MPLDDAASRVATRYLLARNPRPDDLVRDLLGGLRRLFPANHIEVTHDASLTRQEQVWITFSTAKKGEHSQGVIKGSQITLTLKANGAPWPAKSPAPPQVRVEVYSMTLRAGVTFRPFTASPDKAVSEILRWFKANHARLGV